jgi:MFS family permease
VATPLTLAPAGRWIFAGRALRSFAFGGLSVFLGLYLDRRGFSPAAIGVVFTATMIEDGLFTMILSTIAARVGPARVMAATAPLIALGGFALAAAQSRWLLLCGAVVGTLSPNGQEAGPFAPLEQALLPGTVRSGSAVRAFSWYNVFAFMPAAAGAAAAGGTLGWALRHGFDELRVQRWLLLAYAAAGLLLTLLYACLARHLGATGAPVTPLARLGRLGLGRSRRAVAHLAGLQGLDALAGGFVIQSLLAYWFHRRYGVGPEALGALFLGTNLLSALSFLAASRIAERLGLLNTMVFTHLPSNALLAAVPLAPSFGLAAALLLMRHLLSQMDVPTRQAYTMALVAPEERAAAAGLSASVRALAQACAPAVTGMTLAAATPTPFFLAGALKSAYDLSLFLRFRRVPIEDGRAVIPVTANPPPKPAR